MMDEQVTCEAEESSDDKVNPGQSKSVVVGFPDG